MIEQYSSSYRGKDEARILSRVINNDPKLRIIITTIALGMGVDMRDIEAVYHWGVPSNVLQYWQEVGRAGRTGKAAKAVMYAYGPSIPRAQKTMRDMIAAVKSKTCIRQAVMNNLKLNDHVITLEENPRCCSICSD
jgi:ATP-dependent DNA helicase RecQ